MEYLISELNYKHVNNNRYFLLTMIVFTHFFPEFHVVSIEIFKFYFKSWMLQRMSRMMKHISKAGKVDLGHIVTPPVKFACKPELTLTRLLG